MRSLVLVAIAMIIAFPKVTLVSDGTALIRTFDDDPVGAAPPGFTFTAIRQQTPGRWLVRDEMSRRYLVHLADSGPASGMSVAVLQLPQASSIPIRASVRLKLPDGNRVGGLVWRYRDPENFYAAALDLGGQAIDLYRVVRGNRIRLEHEDDLELDPDGWHALRVVEDSNRIRVYLGGIRVLNARDGDRFETGRAGVWSGGATTGWFDDLRIDEAEDGRR